MMPVGIFEVVLWVSSVLCLACLSSGFVPTDNYLIDCGSSTNNSVGGRVFVADQFYSNVISTPHDITANASSNSISSSYDAALYQTARIFNETSVYTFSVKKQGWHWIRLHFFPFMYGEYDLTTAKFSVSAQNFTLIKEFRSGDGNSSEVREYSVNITSDKLVLSFTPSTGSLAFLNALEIFSLPDELIPVGANTRGSDRNYQSLGRHALQTVERVNMGDVAVFPQNDTLWRLWVSDYAFLVSKNLVTFESNEEAVNFTKGGPTENTAPRSVYGTVTRLNSDHDPNMKANVTWSFDVDPGFDYLVRFHFCDMLIDQSQQLYFNVYIGSLLVYQNLDLLNLTSNTLGAPYVMDVISRIDSSRMLNVSVGPSPVGDPYPNGILNGLEIMKISNSEDSLDVLDSVPPKGSKTKTILIAGLGVGVFIIIVFAVALFLLCRRKKLASSGPVNGKGEFGTSGDGVTYAADGEHRNGTAMFSTSKFGYRFPFLAIQEATDNFNESLVLGTGGFGKVYKGVFSDGTPVAVKRGSSRSQGIAEFQTEIEMLSQFRHRHLVSLIGYCNERNELIIMYEYMQNGTLKDHLYGSSLPCLSWRQRLEICIGAAKGIHYLHTGSARAIIHRDVKSANILLDENLMAKVADFGLSKTGPEFDQTHVTTAVKGSFGYLDPEYLIRQQLTEKSDVYSFGVVMYEVLCGRPVVDPSLPKEEVNLVEWVTKSQKSGQPEQVVDSRLEGQIKPDSLQRFADIAEKCLAECGAARPSMGDVLWNLECALQLQGSQERPQHNNEMASQISHMNSFQSRVSAEQSNMGSMGDLSGVAMSKVFARMVREEMR